MTLRLHDTLAARLALVPGPALGPQQVLRRDAPGGLEPPDYRSANRHCRLLQTCDGWVGLNLAREEDRELIAALVGENVGAGAEWEAAVAYAATSSAAEFRDRAVLLQLPVAVLGEVPQQPLTQPAQIAVPRRVIDLSALWAGPLCAGLLARAGAQVVRIESTGRPDPTRTGSPELDHFLNDGKQLRAFDLRSAADCAQLIDLMAGADALITSARPAALARLGLTPEVLLDANPDLIWAAITAHGWHGLQAQRVGFGDDCAVAGRLVDWQDGAPQFLGDALADPLTGVEAALAVCGAQHGGLIDLAMARIAAGYAERIGGAITEE